jgi:hypothetical protein
METMKCLQRAGNQQTAGRGLFAACFMSVSSSAYASSLKIKAIRYSETSVALQLTTRFYISDDRSLHCLYENFKIYVEASFLNEYNDLGSETGFNLFGVVIQKD